MFDWFWEFLYGLTKWMLKIIDMIMEVSLKLIGINSIQVGNEDTDLITYFLNSSDIKYGFVVSVILAFALLFILTIAAVVRCVVKEKVEDTPLGVCKKAFKNFFLLLLVPTFMTLLVAFMSVFMKAMYQGLVQGSSNTVGSYLFSSFAINAANSEGVDDQVLAQIDYMDTDAVWSVCDLSDFPFFYSWIVGVCMILALGSATLTLVERAISIVLLYLIAPFCVASSVIDDGQRFKAWRDQILIKFLTGFGMLLGVVVYGMLCTLIAKPNVKFFDSSILNAFTKMFFMLGGGVSLRGVQAIVGNIVSNGAGDSAMRDLDMSKHAFGSALGSLTSPINFVSEARGRGLGTAIAHRLGIHTKEDFERQGMKPFQKGNGGSGDGGSGDGGGSGNQNTNSPNQNKNQATNNAINGVGSNNNNGKSSNSGSNLGSGSNQNNNQVQGQKGKSMVDNAIGGMGLNSDIK